MTKSGMIAKNKVVPWYADFFSGVTAPPHMLQAIDTNGSKLVRVKTSSFLEVFFFI